MIRVAVLAPSVWSEVAVAVCVRLARAGFTPVGAVSLPTLHPATILRKAMQWGPRELATYATRRVTGRGSRESLRNEYLADAMRLDGTPLSNLRAAAERLGFPLLFSDGMNRPECIARVREWGTDALVYTGGGILRSEVIGATRIGVLNMHAGLLPEIRGMSCPEWSLLTGVPLGATVHLIDTGIDTGPILLRRELPPEGTPATVQTVRERLSSLGVDLVVEAVQGLDRGTLRPVPQTRRDEDLQYFVIHRALAAAAQRRLDELRRGSRAPAVEAAGIGTS